MSSCDRRKFLARSTAGMAIITVPLAYRPEPANAFIFGFFLRPIVQTGARWAARALYRSTVGRSVSQAARRAPRGSLRRRTAETGNRLAQRGAEEIAEWQAGRLYDEYTLSRETQAPNPVDFAQVEAVQRREPSRSLFAYCTNEGNPARPVIAENPEMLTMGATAQALADEDLRPATVAWLAFPIDTISQTPLSQAQSSQGSVLRYRTLAGEFQTRTLLNRRGDAAQVIGTVMADGFNRREFEWDLLQNGRFYRVSSGIIVDGSRSQARQRRDDRLAACKDWRDRLYFKSRC